jgi:hypothetical protein
MINRPVSPGVKPHLGLKTTFLLLSDSCGFVNFLENCCTSVFAFSLFFVFCPKYSSAAQHTKQTAPKNDSEHVIHTKNYTSDKKQETSKYRSAAVFQEVLTPDDGQYRPKHVVYRRQSENDARLVIKDLKF